MRTFKHLRCLCALLLICGAFGSCGSTTQGSGKIVTETRPVSEFKSVSLSGNAEIEIEQNGKESLSITADDNLMSFLKSEVRGGQLMLNVKDSGNIKPSMPIRYQLSVKNLDEIAISGDATGNAKNIVSEHLKVVLTGECKFSISGSTDHQELLITGDGSYDAESLPSKNANVMITGDGKVKLAVAGKLDVKIIGNGSVEYTGDPEVSQSVIGDGHIRKK